MDRYVTSRIGAVIWSAFPHVNAIKLFIASYAVYNNVCTLFDWNTPLFRFHVWYHGALMRSMHRSGDR